MIKYSYNFLENKIPIPIYIKQRWDGDYAIVASKNLEIYFLNYTSSFILELCNSQNSIRQIVDILFDNFEGIELHELKSDVINTLRDFQWKKIIFIK